MLHLDATVAGAGPKKPAPAAAPGVPPVPTIR